MEELKKKKNHDISKRCVSWGVRGAQEVGLFTWDQ